MIDLWTLCRDAAFILLCVTILHANCACGNDVQHETTENEDAGEEIDAGFLGDMVALDASATLERVEK